MQRERHGPDLGVVRRPHEHIIESVHLQLNMAKPPDPPIVGWTPPYCWWTPPLPPRLFYGTVILMHRPSGNSPRQNCQGHFKGS